ncbi:hypothetical protein [Sphingomonas abietis]|uniref:Nuclear transport factor 2 family protein n=1 Tax=Sphingomonas abietis TaxID=3012344 RepID=A0ABY7NQS3_9SPHN|nr:hypothetical protein [Sphingomonas abietis]WBO23889.1 hypothetical protein PBT88_07205 [Sphingomonas abietis]
MRILIASTLLLAAVAPASARDIPVPRDFSSRDADRAAISALLATYTRAVSSRNQVLFETLLLNKDIPFSDPAWVARPKSSENPTQNYEAFRKAVFEGEPFRQRFRDVHILQNGGLADVTLVFVNSTAKDSSWGWKTLQLIKVAGHWKIASEFFTQQQ